MSSIIKSVKTYRKLAEPSTGAWLVQFFTCTFHVCCKLVETILAAKVITSLTSSPANYKSAYLFLSLDILLIILRNVAMHINYINFCKFYNKQYITMQNKILNKIIVASPNNFKTNSKEKLLNIIGNDIYSTCCFGDYMATKLSKIVQVVCSLIIMFIANVWVGLIVMLLSIVDFFILNYLNHRIANDKNEIYENKDKIFENMSSIIDNKELINDLDATEKYREIYGKQVDTYLKAERKWEISSSYKDNFFYVFYKFVIFIITAFMIYLLSDGALTITLYLIVTPYLLSCTELLNDLINITSSVANMEVSANRINTILNFSSDELAKYGELKVNSSMTDLSMLDVEYTNKDNNSLYYGTLKSTDISFKYQKINLIKGPRNCGKRQIYFILARKIRPTKGTVLLDGIDIENFDKKSYRNILYYTYSTPDFVDGTILENFKLVEKNKKIIEQVCRYTGIYEYIMSLPKGFNTPIQSVRLSQEKAFILGLTRTLLKNSEILLIYELPKGLSAEEKNNIIDIIRSLKDKKTIILFSADNSIDSIADIVYTMEDGKVTDVKVVSNEE